MKLFKNTKLAEADSDGAAERIASYIIGKQRTIAEKLNQRADKLSAKARLHVLILFCLLFGGYCLYLLLDAIN